MTWMIWGVPWLFRNPRMSQVDVAVKQAQRGALENPFISFHQEREFEPTIMGVKWSNFVQTPGPRTIDFGGFVEDDQQIWADLTGHRVGSPFAFSVLRCLESLWSRSKGLQCRCPRGSWELHGDHKLTGRPSSFYYVWICLDGIRASKVS